MGPQSCQEGELAQGIWLWKCCDLTVCARPHGSRDRGRTEKQGNGPSLTQHPSGSGTSAQGLGRPCTREPSREASLAGTGQALVSQKEAMRQEGVSRELKSWSIWRSQAEPGLRLPSVLISPPWMGAQACPNCPIMVHQQVLNE